jgi:hypothetical protein
LDAYLVLKNVEGLGFGGESGFNGPDTESEARPISSVEDDKCHPFVSCYLPY